MASNAGVSNLSASGSSNDSNTDSGHTPTRKKSKFSLSPQALEMRRHNLFDEVNKCQKLIHTLIRLKKIDELSLWESCLQGVIINLTFMKLEVGKSIRNQNGLNAIMHQLNQDLSVNNEQEQQYYPNISQMDADYSQDALQQNPQ